MPETLDLTVSGWGSCRQSFRNNFFNKKVRFSVRLKGFTVRCLANKHFFL